LIVSRATEKGVGIGTSAQRPDAQRPDAKGSYVKDPYAKDSVRLLAEVLLCFVAWNFLLSACTTLGQEPMPAVGPASQAGASPGAGVQGLVQMPRDGAAEILGTGVLPDLMLMRNEKGEEVLVPRTTYEDFERRLMDYQLGENGRGGLPNLTQLDLTIEPVSDYAKVNARTSLLLKQPNQVLWEVPLGLGQLQWLPSYGPKAEGIDGSGSIALVSRGNGYLWRLMPNRGTERKFEADALCKLSSSTTSSSMRLDLPAAATVVKLKLPKGDWELNASGGGNEVIEPFQIQGDHSVAIIRTSSASLSLVWSRKLEREATAAIEVRSDTKFSPSNDVSQWRAVSTLSIRGPWKLGGKRFRWNLPPRSTLRETNSASTTFPNYRIVRDAGQNAELSPSLNEAIRTEDPSSKPADATAAGKPESWWIEIEESFARTELELAIEWTTAKAESGTNVLFAPIAFEEVDRHTGVIDVIIPKSISLDWKPEGNAQLQRQTQAADGSDSLVYTFQFESQPASILSHWTTIVDQPKIQSDLQLEVREKQLVMRGVWRFGTDPIQLPLMQLEAQGWKPERIVLYPSEVSLPLESFRPAGTGVQAPGNEDLKWSLPIAANLWIRSASATRLNEVGESGRIDGRGENRSENRSDSRSENRSDSRIESRGDKLSDATGPTSSVRAPNDFDSPASDSKAGADWRIEFVLSCPIDTSALEVGISIPQLSWLSQESQQRVVRAVPGRLLLYAWPYRLTTDIAQSSGLVAIPPERSKNKEWGESWGNGVVPYHLQYLVSEGVESARWKGARSRKGSFVTANLSASVRLAEQFNEWSVLWNARAFGSRPDAIIVNLPNQMESEEAAADLRDASFFVDGIACEWAWLAAEDPSVVGQKRARVQLPPISTEGDNRLDFLLECRFRSHSAMGAITGDKATWDLELPSIGTEREQERWVVDAATVNVQAAADASWHLSDERSNGAIEVDPVTLHAQVPVHRAARTHVGNVLIEGEWVQTIVNALDQRDRYVARIATDLNAIEVSIADGLKRDADWILDGQRVTARVDTDRPGVAVVPLPDASKSAVTDGESEKDVESRIHVLEIFTSERAPRGWWRSVKPLSTKVVGSTAPGAMVWQVLVPRTEYLVWNSQNLLPVYQWHWQDFFFRRSGSYTQGELESRFHATHQPVVSQQVNQYDMTSLAYTDELRATFLPSALVWLPASLFVLGLTMLMKDQRWMRRPWLWACFLCAFFLFSQVALDISLLVFQGAVASMALAVFYSLVRWVLDRRARRRSVFVSRQYTPAASANPKNIVPKRNSPSSVVLHSTVTAEGKESL
jgi:hypothetical protein